MKRKQIIERIAEEREVPLHTAADWLDSFLHDLMQQLRGPAHPIKDNAPETPQPPPAVADLPPAATPACANTVDPIKLRPTHSTAAAIARPADSTAVANPRPADMK